MKKKLSLSLDVCIRYVMNSDQFYDDIINDEHKIENTFCSMTPVSILRGKWAKM